MQYLGQRQSRALRPEGRGVWLQNRRQEHSGVKDTNRSESSMPAHGHMIRKKLRQRKHQPQSSFPRLLVSCEISNQKPGCKGTIFCFVSFVFLSVLKFFRCSFQGSLIFFFLVKVLKKFCKAIDLYAFSLNQRDSFVSPGITSCKLF